MIIVVTWFDYKNSPNTIPAGRFYPAETYKEIF